MSWTYDQEDRQRHACSMFHADEYDVDEKVPQDIKWIIDEIDSMCEDAGGKLRSRQVIALIIYLYNKGIIGDNNVE